MSADVYMIHTGRVRPSIGISALWEQNGVRDLSGP